MDEIIEIKFKTAKFEILTKFPFIRYINHLWIYNRTRHIARNTPTVPHAGVSTCGQNCIGPMVTSQLQQCQSCPPLGQHWLTIYEVKPRFPSFQLDRIVK